MGEKRGYNPTKEGEVRPNSQRDYLNSLVNYHDLIDGIEKRAAGYPEKVSKKAKEFTDQIKRWIQQDEKQKTKLEYENEHKEEILKKREDEKKSKEESRGDIGKLMDELTEYIRVVKPEWVHDKPLQREEPIGGEVTVNHGAGQWRIEDDAQEVLLRLIDSPKGVKGRVRHDYGGGQTKADLQRDMLDWTDEELKGLYFVLTGKNPDEDLVRINKDDEEYRKVIEGIETRLKTASEKVKREAKSYQEGLEYVRKLFKYNEKLKSRVPEILENYKISIDQNKARLKKGIPADKYEKSQEPWTNKELKELQYILFGK